LPEAELADVLRRLQHFYGLLPSPPRDPFALFVWEILSTHALPARREAALAALRRIPALTPDSLWRAPQAQLEAAVSLAGPYLEQRLSALRRGVQLFRRTPRLPDVIRGPLPAARRALKSLPQLGASGARRMLLLAADRAVLPVDARVQRVGSRLGFGRGSTDLRTSARSVSRALTRELAGDLEGFRDAFLYLDHHAAATCTEVDPHCAICPLLRVCPAGRARISERVICDQPAV
jgi:endonuclease III